MWISGTILPGIVIIWEFKLNLTGGIAFLMSYTQIRTYTCRRLMAVSRVIEVQGEQRLCYRNKVSYKSAHAH